MSGFLSKVKKIFSEVKDSPWTDSSSKTAPARYEEVKACAFKNFEDFECSDPILKKFYDGELERCKESSKDFSSLSYFLKDIAILRTLIESHDFGNLFNLYMEKGGRDEFGKFDPDFGTKKLEKYAHVHGQYLISKVVHILSISELDGIESKGILSDVFYEDFVTDEERNELREDEEFEIVSRLSGIFSAYELFVEDEVESIEEDDGVDFFQECDLDRFVSDFKMRYMSKSVFGRLINNKYFAEVVDDDVEAVIANLDDVATDDAKFHYLVMAVQTIEYIRALEMCDYLEPLLLKYSELSYFDDYGDLDDSAFDEEFNLFLEKKNQRVIKCYTQNIKSISDSIDYRVFEEDLGLDESSGYLYQSIKSNIKLAFLFSIESD